MFKVRGVRFPGWINCKRTGTAEKEGLISLSGKEKDDACSGRNEAC